MTETSFIKLKKLAKSVNAENADCHMVITGDCATQHLAAAVAGFAVSEKVRLSVTDTDYDLISAQIIDEFSPIYTEKPDFVLIYMSTEKLEREFYASADRESFAENKIKEIEGLWDTLSARIKTNILQFDFAENDDGTFGSFALKTPVSFLFQLRKLNFLFSCAAAERGNVFPVSLCGVQALFSHSRFRDDKLYYAAKLAVSTEALPELAKRVVDVVKAVRGKIKKCVICDLDNTLWGGVIGDDGINSIEIGELGVGHAFEQFQRRLKELKQRGIILCVCSKNNEQTAKEPFEKHPEMVLRLEDISVFIANWQDKASNIREIQRILNIGFDSMVFLDDNAFERNLVRSMLPEITVPELPEDPAEYAAALEELNLFETAAYSSADKDRTGQYRAEASRVAAEKQFENYGEYLESLEMLAGVHPFDEEKTPRIAQLTQRSNQFNLRTVRCTAADIAAMAEDSSYITLYFTLKDKFGDHGLISLVMLKKRGSEELFIENWLMSCRVLKRTTEEFVINTVMETAKKNGFRRVVGEYIKTPKNSMVENIYSDLGFSDLGDNLFLAETDSFTANKTYIKNEE